METLTISKINAIKAYQQAPQDGKKLLSNLFGPGTLDVPVTERIKTYSDACAELGIIPLTEDDFRYLPEEDRESQYAYHQLTIIIRVLNEGWKPDWNNSNEYKYYVWQQWAGSGFAYYDFDYTYTISNVGSRLIYKNRELAVWAGKQFESIYNKFFNQK